MKLASLVCRCAGVPVCRCAGVPVWALRTGGQLFESYEGTLQTLATLIFEQVTALLSSLLRPRCKLGNQSSRNGNGPIRWALLDRPPMALNQR